MYPLKVDQAYPYNQWWVAAYASELTPEPLGRTILGERVVMYRTRAGEPVALAGLCPHRGLPLEMGRLEDDNLVCGYHGFRFASSGKCVEIPSQDKVPDSFCTRKYPLAQRGDFVWIWTGAPELADESKVPDLLPFGVGDAAWHVEQRPILELKARYTLLIDNLMDLSHVTFIHPVSIPGGQAVVRIPIELTERQGRINAVRRGKGLPTNPLHQQYFPGYTGPIDRHFDSELFGPCLVRTGGEMFNSDTGAYLGAVHYMHAMTPIDEYNTRYLILVPRDIQQGNEAFDKASLGSFMKIQPEDTLILERIEEGIQSRRRPQPEISARVDTPALKARYLIERQINAELADGPIE
jgi:phenylpropionate dioxygenase-like ring-hydroxylating dioxygenase large terminal subunit